MWFAEHPDEVEAAKAACLTCPLQRECLAGALERAEPWGVWGGQLFIAGEVVARKRPRGRPRKDALADWSTPPAADGQCGGRRPGSGALSAAIRASQSGSSEGSQL